MKQDQTIYTLIIIRGGKKFEFISLYILNNKCIISVTVFLKTLWLKRFS